MLARSQALILAAAAAMLAALAVVLYVMTRRTDPVLAPVAPAPMPAVVRDAAVRPAEALDVAPVVTPDAPSAARAERELLLARVIENHAGTEPWDAQGLAILQAIAAPPATVTDLDCYMAGCIATFTFPSLAAYRDAVAHAEANAAYAAWTGGKQYTSPESLPDGRVIVTLLLNRPD